MFEKHRRPGGLEALFQKVLGGRRAFHEVVEASVVDLLTNVTVYAGGDEEIGGARQLLEHRSEPRCRHPVFGRQSDLQVHRT